MAVFDNNGTLYDDFDVIFGGVVSIHRKFGLRTPTKKQFHSMMTHDFMAFHRRFGFPKYKDEEDEKQLKKVITETFKTYVEAHIHQEAGFRPDVAMTMCELKRMGVRTAMVSAMEQSELLKLLNRFGYRGVFDPVWGSIKDKEAALRGLCHNSHRSALYVDDTVEGTSAANRAGLLSIGIIAPGAYHSPERLRAVTPHLIENISDLIFVVRGVNG